MKIVIVIGLLLGIVSGSLFAQVDSSLNAVDIPPLFEGCNDPLVSTAQRQTCSAPKIQAFIRANITYPDSAKVHQAEGIVVVRFTVDETGVISQLELIRDIGHGCGQEAMRVVRMMPAFIYPVQYLSVQVVGKHKLKEEKGKSNTLTKRMQRLLLGTKRNQQIIFEATVLKDYQEIEVSRILYIQ